MKRNVPYTSRSLPFYGRFVIEKGDGGYRLADKQSGKSVPMAGKNRAIWAKQWINELLRSGIEVDIESIPPRDDFTFDHDKKIWRRKRV